MGGPNNIPKNMITSVAALNRNNSSRSSGSSSSGSRGVYLYLHHHHRRYLTKSNNRNLFLFGGGAALTSVAATVLVVVAASPTILGVPKPESDSKNNDKQGTRSPQSSLPHLLSSPLSMTSSSTRCDSGGGSSSSRKWRGQQQQQKHQQQVIDGIDKQGNGLSSSGGDHRFRIESHLMDKIQQKKYITSALARDGIPSTLRILAIDLPNLKREGFTGTCRVSHTKIFPETDPIAPSNEVLYTTTPTADGDASAVTKENNSNSGEEDDASSSKNNSTRRKSSTSTRTASAKPSSSSKKLKVPQKLLVKRLVECNSPQSQQLVGIELLEASVADLNRYQLRKTQKFGSYKYDPGKYFDDNTTTNKNATSNTNSTTEGSGHDNDDDEMDGIDVDYEDYDYDYEFDKHTNYDDDDDDGADGRGSSHASRNTALQNEMEAPWNQTAWKEELSLRINGQVQFDAAMESAPKLQRLLWGKVYKSTIPTVHTVWDYFLPNFAKSDPNGVDGSIRLNVRACHKPHAVIANGAALQLVPGSLRQLQRLCKKADVPLFVINDPRRWGGNTHDSLDDALKELRSTVKNRVITQALKQQGSFARGRLLGQTETEAKWQLKERSKRAKEFLGIDSRHRRSERNQNWSTLDSSNLQRKLIERKVIRVERGTTSVSSSGGSSSSSAGGDTASTNGNGDSVPEKLLYSDGLIDLARQVTEDQRKENVSSQGECDNNLSHDNIKV